MTPPKKSSSSGSKELGYIVGLPEDDPEADLARTKFERTVSRLAVAYPSLQEVRATVKMDSSKGDRKHFEVEAFVLMDKGRFTFKEGEWSLAEVFDTVVERLKRLMTKSETKPANRRRIPRGVREANNPEELGLG